MSEPSTARIELPFHDGTLTISVRTKTPIPSEMWVRLREIAEVAERLAEGVTA